MFAFADSTNPEAIDAAKFSHVAGYANGKYAWSDHQFARFKRHFKIAVKPGDPSQARLARCLDIERFDATVADAAPFALDRAKAGHDDCLFYCSLSVVPALVSALRSAKAEHPDAGKWGLWAAWWWQKPHAPTAAEVSAELKRLSGVTLPAGKLRGCQWQPGGAIDRSVWYAPDNFSPAKP
ncbi:MAG TPA: hypothetical protein VN767_12775 [Streptosporangiaceae bacterium]|jgi:hypothetical protein|nr:hypothetical protein [Streptosporangiaceae bacterium]